MSTVALLRLTLKFAKSYWLFIVFVVVLQLASTIAALYLPSLNARIIDEGVAEGDTDFIWSTGMTMLIVCLVQVITAVTAIYFGARSAMGVGRDIRRAIYSRVDELSTLEVGRFGSATLITRNTNDVQQVQM
ncbi:ABC transporter transmembrane domain-containing protein, partial [Burkholderia multivorans]